MVTAPSSATTLSGSNGSRICLLTGATYGIGEATAISLAGLGFNLILTGRSVARGEAQVRRLQSRFPAQTFEFHAADISSLDAVRQLADGIASRHQQIDVLINNAGARIDAYGESADGIELTFATNHLGHFLLTALLLDRLLVSPASRVVTVASRRHRFVKATSPWVVPREGYSAWEVYSRSKLANTLFAFELARKLRTTTAVSNAVDPGIVASNFSRNNGLLPWLKHIVSSWRNRQLVSCGHAAATLVYAAASPETVGQTGKYYCEKAELAPAPIALDTSLSARLWQQSVDLAGLSRDNCRAWSIIAP